MPLTSQALSRGGFLGVEYGDLDTYAVPLSRFDN
jgi:hypothetical protein